jgi:hypothetical protein
VDRAAPETAVPGLSCPSIHTGTTEEVVLKIINQTNLVREIKKNLSKKDYEDFKNKIVRTDQILNKIWNFTFPLFTTEHISNPSTFPLKQKKEIFERITEDDWIYFFDKYLKTFEGPQKKSFKLLKWAFEAMYGGIKYLIDFPETDKPKDVIFKQTGWHVITEFVDEDGNKRIRTEIGKYWPDAGITYWCLLKGNTPIRVECHVDWLLRKPTPKEIKKHDLDWEIHAIEMFAGLEDIEEYEKILLGVGHQVEYQIKNFHNGKLIHTDKKRHFTLPLVRKYDRLLNKQLNGATDKHLIEWPFDDNPRFIKFRPDPDTKEGKAFESYERDKEAFWYGICDEFRQTMLDWDKNRPTDIPAPHFDLKLREFVTGLFRDKAHSTTAGDAFCDPENIDDWYYCKHRTSKDDDLESPECDHRDGGLCKCSEKKRKRIDEKYSEMQAISDDGTAKPYGESENGEGKGEYYIDDLIWEDEESDEESNERYIISKIVKDETDERIMEMMLDGQASWEKRKTGLNYSEIGREVRLSDNAVRKRIEKIREKIKSNFPELLKEFSIPAD